MFYKKSGFTLIELMIVILIIGVLIAIAIPNFIAATDKAKIASLKSNMRTLKLAVETYAVDQLSYPDSYFSLKSEAITNGYWKDLKNPFSVAIDTGLDIDYTLAPDNIQKGFKSGSLRDPTSSNNAIAPPSLLVSGVVAYCGSQKYAIYGCDKSEGGDFSKLNLLFEKGNVFYLTNN